MLPPWEVNPGPLILLCYMLVSEMIPPLTGSLSPLDPYIVMLYWLKKNSKSKNQHSMNL